MSFQLRRASPLDAEEVAAVYVTSSNAGFNGLLPSRDLTRAEIDRWRRDLAQGPVTWWVVEHEGKVVGFAGSGPSRDPVDPHLGELDTIAVDPRAWRQGVGLMLMSAALTDLWEVGYRQAVVWTLSGHTQALGFYRATGWKASGESRAEETQIALRRSLVRP